MSTEQILATCREALVKLSEAERELVLNWLNSEFRAPAKSTVRLPYGGGTWPLVTNAPAVVPVIQIDTPPNTGGPVCEPPCRVTCGTGEVVPD